jgi:hypothetical protein
VNFLDVCIIVCPGFKELAVAALGVVSFLCALLWLND